MKISICTLTARRGFVEHQARMLAKQDYPDIEWILIDFVYEERVKTLCDLSKELGLKIIHSPNVRGGQMFFRDITRNRNLALKLATGGAVIFLDDYACVGTDFVSKHLPLLLDNCISAGQMHRLERSLDEDVMQKVEDTKLLLNVFEMGKDYRNRDDRMYKATGITYTGNLGIPRIIFEHLNGFDPRMESGLEDCDFGMRATMSKFMSMYNPAAYTINLSVGNAPYTYHFDHAHDVEPFISNPNNNFWGDATLKENDFMTVSFHEGYRVAHCKTCGAQSMIDPNELISWKDANKEKIVPEGLVGGYR